MIGFTDDQRPYFFLSYARHRLNDGLNPDKWVTKLFNDLRQDIHVLTGCANPGFMDQQQLKVGVEWSDGLAEALAGCRVFLPLYSPRYFLSEYCGREWSAFNQRLIKHTGGGSVPAAIIPALWTPMELDALPDLAGTRQLIQADFPQPYETEGFYGIMKLGRYREAYKQTVLRLAKAIIDAADSTNLNPGDQIDLDSVPSAFEGFQHRLQRQQVRVTVAACDLYTLPRGRDPYYYGRQVQEWSPYRAPSDHLPIARYAEQVISCMGYQPEVQDLGKEPTAGIPKPDVMLVDAWATEDPGIGEELRTADECPTIVVIPANEEDTQTVDAHDRLDEAIDRLLAKCIARPGSVRGIPTIDRFRWQFVGAVNEAIRHHLKTAPVGNPSPTPRPRLLGPGS